MRYRVAFTFKNRQGLTYHSEWFDTFGEALQFVTDGGDAIAAHRIEPEEIV